MEKMKSFGESPPVEPSAPTANIVVNSVDNSAANDSKHIVTLLLVVGLVVIVFMFKDQILSMLSQTTEIVESGPTDAGTKAVNGVWDTVSGAAGALWDNTGGALWRWATGQ